jgi:protein phosphatase
VTRFDQIEHASLTDVGVRRSHNQDNFCVQVAVDDAQWRQRGHLFLVADGMGAHAVGEKASEQAAGVIPHTYNKYAEQGPAGALRKAFTEANASIHACGQANREFEGMGTTASALVLRPDGAWIGHVGDSRVYRVRDGVIEQLSYDHSLVWEYARLKHIDPDEVEDIPSNVIHRCLGPEPIVKVDVEGPHPVRPGDTFLLCSDGLSGQVSDLEMGAVLSVLPLTEACRFLVDMANLRGGPDNITVLVVRVGGEPDAAESAPAAAPRPGFPYPWWVPALVGGTLLAVVAAILASGQLPGGVAAFVLAGAAILSGLAGAVLHVLRERQQPEPEEDEPEPRIHRRAVCRIEQPLLERLGRVLDTLRQRVDERHWEADWEEYRKHHDHGDELLRQPDLTAAFREYCLALLPLTQTLARHRNKEESFQPVWDKSR